MTFDQIRGRESVAWAAGIFEGEGCITGGVGKRGRHIQLAIAMTDRDVLEKFMGVFGCGYITERKRRGPKSYWKTCYVWRIGTFEGVQAVMAMMWPWLCGRRRAKAALVLTKYREHGGGTGDANKARDARILEALRIGGRTQRSIASEFGVGDPYVSWLKRHAA